MYLLPNYIATCKSPSPQDAAIVGTRVDTVTHVRVYHHRISFRSQPTAKPYASMILTARLRECDIECPRTRARRRMARSAVCGPSCALLYQRGTYISWYIYMESINTRIKHPLEKFSEMVHITSTLQPLRQLIFLLLLHRHTGTMHGQ